jgi:hypothetical protein
MARTLLKVAVALALIALLALAWKALAAETDPAAAEAT